MYEACGAPKSVGGTFLVPPLVGSNPLHLWVPPASDTAPPASPKSQRCPPPQRQLCPPPAEPWVLPGSSGAPPEEDLNVRPRALSSATFSNLVQLPRTELYSSKVVCIRPPASHQPESGGEHILFVEHPDLYHRRRIPAESGDLNVMKRRFPPTLRLAESPTTTPAARAATVTSSHLDIVP